MLVVGVGVIVAGVLFCLLYLFTVVGMVLAIRGGRVLLPRLLLSLLYLFRGMLMPVAKALLKDEYGAEHAAIILINSLHKEGYRRVSLEERIVVLPQCLRDIDCKAPIDPRSGIECMGCGGCVIGRLKRRFPKLRIFVTPGGRFAERIVLSERPKAVLGVACANDLYEGTMLCHREGIAVQGLELLRAGCVETAVDEKKLFELAGRGYEDLSSS